MSPLATEYPQNPIFQLILGDTQQAKLAHWQSAAGYFRAATQLSIPDAACAQRVRALALEALMLMPSDPHGSTQ